MSSDKAPNPTAASAAVAINASIDTSSGAGAVANANASLHPGVESSKGVNGLDKLILHDPRGSSAEAKNDVTPALGLPPICKAPTNISRCPESLHLDPKSLEPQVFYQLEGRLTPRAVQKMDDSGGSNMDSFIYKDEFRLLVIEVSSVDLVGAVESHDNIV
ncbi:hypothetical protein ACFXTH_012789 [Malus domestica]